MRFIGSKRLLLNKIDYAIQQNIKNHNNLKTFCDIFSGTLSVSMALKRNGYRVISNDINKFSYSFGISFLKNNSIPVFNFKAIPHWEIADKFRLIDFELGVKITGAGFPIYRGKGAKLQRALINFFLDEAEAAGYSEVIPPHLVNEASGYGTGQLPDKEGQMYHVGEDDLYLID